MIIVSESDARREIRLKLEHAIKEHEKALSEWIDIFCTTPLYKESIVRSGVLLGKANYWIAEVTKYQIELEETP